MTPKGLDAPIPRICLTPAEAAASLGVGVSFFYETIAPELRVIYRGRKRLYPVAELEQWAHKSAGYPIENREVV